MEDVSVPVKNESSKKPKKNRTVTLKINRDILVIIIAAVLVIAAYFVGVHNGREQAKKDRTSSLSNLERGNNPASASNRWTSVGTVQEASDNSIKVVDSRKETKQAKITKDTTIVDRKGTKLAAKDIKKDQRVIISGTKDDKGNLTATRIRIQQ